jgi:hypothetical protein
MNSRAMMINNQTQHQSFNNNSIVFSNARRYLTQQQNQPQLDKSELDKPQWERSDRYVNLNDISIHESELMLKKKHIYL